MLLDYVAREPRAEEEGVRVAGLLDIVKLAQVLGRSIDGPAVKAMRDEAIYDPGLAYETSKTFIDPISRLMVDTGPTYEGKRLREYQSLSSLMSRGQSLTDYLKGTPMGDALAPHMPDIRVGVTEMSGFEGGFGPPKDGRPGVLAISSNVDKARLPGIFEHEMQHVYQHLLDMPRGTTPDEMSDEMMQYLIEAGVVRPAMSARIDRAAADQGVTRGAARYMSTIGEAEARAAQVRQDNLSGGLRYEHLGRPSVEQYSWTGDGYDPRMNFFALPQDADTGFRQWWQKRQGGN